MNKAVIDVLDLNGPPVAVEPAGNPLTKRASDRVATAPVLHANDAATLVSGLQALFRRGGVGCLDLGARDIVVDAPLGLPSVIEVATRDRRVIRNGRILCRPGSANWSPATQHCSASYSPSNPLILSNVASVASIPVGALVEGAGVGREIYVTARRPEAGEITLSHPLWGAAANQIYSFTTFRHALDLTNAKGVCDLELVDLDVDCSGVASGIRLPGSMDARLERCEIRDIGDRGVTLVGDGTLRIDGGGISGGRTDAIALTAGANGASLRGLRAESPVILHGRHHRIDGSDLSGGLVLTTPGAATVLTANRFLNAGLELTDECGTANGQAETCAIGGVSVTGNLFSAKDPAPEFRWITVRPHGIGSALANLSVTGNTFVAIGTRARRIESVDTTCASLDLMRTRAVTFDGNVVDGVDQPTMNPVTLEFDQPTNATVWTLNVSDHLPFGGHARTVTAVVPNGPVRTAAETAVHGQPTVRGSVGARHGYVQLVWPEPCRGKVFVTVRIDRPV